MTDNQLDLFNIDNFKNEPTQAELNNKRCKSCEYCNYAEYGRKRRFYYCEKQKCNRSQFGIKKIKARDFGCGMYKEESKK